MWELENLRKWLFKDRQTTSHSLFSKSRKVIVTCLPPRCMQLPLQCSHWTGLVPLTFQASFSYGFPVWVHNGWSVTTAILNGLTIVLTDQYYTDMFASKIVYLISRLTQSASYYVPDKMVHYGGMKIWTKQRHKTNLKCHNTAETV